MEIAEMKSYPFHVVTGEAGPGVSYSSWRQIGDWMPSQPLGQAQVRVFYNIASGNVSIADHLWTLAGLSEPLVLGYYFNSQVPLLNTAWRLPVSHLTPPASGSKQVIFTESDGHETPYTQTGELYVAPGLTDGTPYLQWQPKTNQWFWHHPKTHLSALYDKNGVLLERRDQWGNATQYTYDSKGLLQTIVGPSRNRYTFQRNYKTDGSREETLWLTRPDGAWITLQRYQFDKDNLLTLSETSLDGQNFKSVYQTTYTYTEKTPRLQLSKITQTDGTQMQLNYGLIAPPEQKAKTPLKPGLWRLLSIEMGAGEAVTRAEFTYNGNRIRLAVGNPGWLADFVIDTRSRISQVIQYTGDTDTSRSETTRYEYAASGQLQTLTRPDGSRESWAYLEKFGLVTQHVRPNGQETRYYYDIGRNNRPLLQTQEQISLETKQSLYTYYVHERRTNGSANPADEKDYCRYQITPMGRMTALEPSTQGPVQYQRVYLSAAVEFSGHSTNAPTFSNMQTWEGQQNPQAVQLTEYRYDAHGLVQETRRYATVDSKGSGVEDTQMSVTTREWNDYGQWERQVKQLVRDSKGVVTTAQTQRHFDGLRRLIKSTDPLGNITTTAYTAYEEKACPTGVYAVTVTQPNGRIEKTVLNAQGDPVCELKTVPSLSDEPPTQTTQWRRDSAGRVTATQHPDGRITTQTFDESNRLTARISATGLVTEFQRDETHRYQCEIVEHDRYTYRFYDESHRLRFSVDAKQYATENQYDSLNRLIATVAYADRLTDAQLNTLKAGESLCLTPNLRKDRCTSYYYDDDGHLMGQIDTAGWVTERVLDNAAQLSREIRYSTPNRTEPRSMDFKEMRPAAKSSDAIYYFFRNAQGQPTVTVSPEGFVTACTYLASTRLQRQTRFYNKVDASWYYTTGACPRLPATNSEDETTVFSYDLLERTVNTTVSDGSGLYREWTPMGQLALERRYDTRFSGTEGDSDPDHTRTTQYRYDGWDNRVQTAPPMVSQQLSENPTKAEEIWQTASVRDQYDEVTGLTLKSTNTLGQTTIYYYDQERRLALSISPKGSVVRLFYNAFHDRVMRLAYATRIPAKNVTALTGGFITDAVLALIVADEASDVVQQFEYDKRSQVVSERDPEQYLFLYDYNAFRERVTEQIPVQEHKPSLMIQHSFNPRGQEIGTTRTAGEICLTVTQQFENLFGQLTDHTDEVGALTQYSYDREGRTVETVNALGVISHHYTRDAFGRVLTDTDAQDQTTRWEYHQVSRSQMEYPPVQGTQTVTRTNIFNQRILRIDALNSERHTYYGPDGQLTRSVNELGLTTTHDYDTDSRLTSHVDPSGLQTVNEYDDDGYLIVSTQRKAYHHRDLVTRYERDAFGRAVALTNPRRVITQQVFSQRGLVVKTVRDIGTDSAPGLRLIQQSTYNGQSTQTSLIQGDEKKQDQYAIAFQQDGFNRSIGKMIDPDGEKPLKLTTSIELSAVSQVISHTDGAGRTTLSFYDLLGQKRFSVDADGGLMEWQYNQVLLPSLTCRYEKALTPSQLSAITPQTSLRDMETLAAAKHHPQDTVTYFYYDGHRRERFTVQMNGPVVEKRYNGADHLIQTIRYAARFDADDLTDWSTAQLCEWAADHADDEDRLTVTINDDSGQVRFTIDSRSVVIEQRYDELGRVIAVIRYAEFIHASVAANYSLEQMEEAAQQMADPTQDWVLYTVFNVFNKPEYLVKTTLPPQCAVTQYEHDEAGNPARTIRYEAGLPCHAATVYEDLEQHLFTLTPDERIDRITVITWDTCDRVSEEIDELGYQTVYQRDALDNLITRTDPAGFEWGYDYDRAKRLTLESTPLAPIGFIREIEGRLQYQEKTRAIKTTRRYDGVHNPIEKIADADGDEPRAVTATFSAHNQQTTLTVPSVEVDDPKQPVRLTSRPVTKKDIVTRTVYHPKQQKIVEINAQGDARFWVYDALERLTYQVDPLGYVIGYTRNTFGEVTIEAQYATRLTLDLSWYVDAGIPIDVITAHLVESDEDRYTFYERDKGGNPISTIRGIAKPSPKATLTDLKGVLFYYCAATDGSGFSYAQTNQEFDAFNQVRLTAIRIATAPVEIWAEKYAWYDGSGASDPIAIAESVNSTIDAPLSYRVTRVIKNTFLQPVQEIQYANYLDLNPAALTVSQLDKLLSKQTSAKDRVRQFQYNLKGELIAVSRVGVTRESLVLGSLNQISFQSYANLTLVERYSYDPRGLKTLTTHESLPGKTPTQECQYYDARGLTRAHLGVTFATVDEKGVALKITPLTYDGMNAHGQKVRKIEYLSGAGSASTAPDKLPTPLLPDEKQDKEELKQADSRGKISAQQNAGGHLERMTYTSTGETARTYWALTNYQESAHLDEKRQSYNARDQVILVDLRRDDVSQRRTALLYNAFGETVAEGPGDDKRDEKSTPTASLIAPGKSTAQWPLYRTVNAMGQVINTNDQKIPQIHCYDLSGAQTALLVSPTMDLSVVEQKDFPSLLTQPYNAVEQTRYVRDLAHRLVAQRLPDWEPGVAGQPQYVPLEIVAGSLYSSLGRCSLSWVTPVLNAEPVFYLYPANASDQKTELKIQHDESTGRSGVDVSDRQTGVYDYRIDYYLIDPTSHLPTTRLVYQTYGRVSLATENNDKTTAVVATVQADHQLWLTGAVAKVTAVDLVDAAGQTVKRYTLQAGPVTSQKWVDLSAEASGHYTAVLISGDVAGASTSAFMINTPLAPTVDRIVTREIPVTAQITWQGQDGVLSLWSSLPLDYQETPVQMRCDYLDDIGDRQILEARLTPTEDQTATVHFATPVQRLLILNLYLQISETESVPLYVTEPPAWNWEALRALPPEPAEVKDTEEDFIVLDTEQIRTAQAQATSETPVTASFVSHRIVYIRGLAVENEFKQPPLISFKDVSQALQATWKDVRCTGVNPRGLIIDISLLPPGNYPFVLPHGDPAKPYTFVIALGAQVFDSSAHPPDEKQVLKTPAPVPRLRRLALDVFDNLVSSTDTLGFTTDYEYNDLNQRLQQLDPPISVTDADGRVTPQFRGLTQTHRNVDGVVIGKTKPAGNSEAYVLNEQNRQINKILGDGLSEQAELLDGFGRSVTLYDSRAWPTQRLYDRMDNILQQTVLNGDGDNQSGKPLVSVLAYNERNKRTLSQDPAGNQTRYLYNAMEDVTKRINPRGDAIDTQWDRNHQKNFERWASGYTQTWRPDPVLEFFSVCVEYVDLGGAVIAYEYDRKFQQRHIKSRGGSRGETAILSSYYSSNKQTTVYQLITVKTPDQDLWMTYNADQLVRMDDVSQQTQTVLNYDAEGRLIYRQVVFGAPSTWHTRTMQSTLNALGDEIAFFDTAFSGVTVYDRNRNRRRRTGKVVWQGIPMSSTDDWYESDAADRPVTVQGSLVNGHIVIKNSPGMFIQYNQGVRVQEIQGTASRHIDYYPDGDISQIRDFDGTLTQYHYAPSGYRSLTATYPLGKGGSTDILQCDADLFQTHQTSTYPKSGDTEAGTDDTTIAGDADNNIGLQVTKHYSGKTQVFYMLTFSYALFEDTYQQSVVIGDASDDYGHKYSQSAMYYNPNGALNGQRGGYDKDPKKTGKLSIYNFCTPENIVLEKLIFPTNPEDKDIPTMAETYFYDVNNNYLGSYGVPTLLTSGSGGLLKATSSSSSIKLRWDGIKNIGRFAPFNLHRQAAPQSSRGARYMPSGQVVPAIQPHLDIHETLPRPKHWEHTHEMWKMHLRGHRSTQKDNLDTDAPHNEEYVQPITNTAKLSVPDKYTVKSGDTFDRIAQTHYGDPTYAAQIAVKNNYPSAGAQPIVDSVLMLPAFVPITNRGDSHVPYDTFQAAIYPSFYPALKFAQPKPKKHSCVQTVILVTAAVIATVTASAIVPALGPIVQGFTAHLLATGATAALLDAGIQGVAVSMGALKHFSLESVIQTALSAAIFDGVRSWVGQDAKFGYLLLAETSAAGATDISVQLARLAAGWQPRLDLTRTLLAMAQAAANAAIMHFITPAPEMMRAYRSLVMDSVQSLVSAVTGSAIMGGPINLENAFAEAFGSFTGRSLGGLISQEIPPASRVQLPSLPSAPLLDPHWTDYHAAVVAATPVWYDLTQDPWHIHDISWQTYAADLTSPQNPVLGTSRVPKSTGLQPSRSITQPNSYTVTTQRAQQELKEMLLQNQTQFLDERFGDDSKVLQGVSLVPSAFSPASKIAQWIFDNQSNWMGKSALYTLKGTDLLLGKVAAQLGESAEMSKMMNPIITGTELIWGAPLKEKNLDFPFDFGYSTNPS
jgi:YD repeat-containing protein